MIQKRRNLEKLTRKWKDKDLLVEEKKKINGESDEEEGKGTSTKL